MNFAEFIKIKYLGAGIVFITPKKEVLLLQKENSKWTFPGGHREEGEYSPLETAYRECQEELGLVPDGELVGKLKITKDGEKQSIYSFFMFVKDSFMPTLSWEHKDYKWVNYKKLKEENLTSVFKPYWKLYKKVISKLP
jgi:8-oxo-dGTP pyrophosphatase MutT (NUDIX family)